MKLSIENRVVSLPIGRVKLSMTFPSTHVTLLLKGPSRAKRALVKSVALGCLLAMVTFAQTPGILNGLVADESGGAIAGASVTLDDQAGRPIASTTTNGAGSFTLSGLPAGHYQLHVEKAAFGPAHMDVIIGPAAPPALHVVLKVAVVREAVEVVRASPEELGYSVDNAVSAAKTDTPVMETPFSVQAVPNQVIQDQQATRLQDITRNVSGVQTNFGYGGLYEAFALRGFETNVTLRNGERAAGGIGRSSVDVANLEEVEVLKGPAAMIYGRLEPGGMINVVTKKPSDASHYSLQQQFGSFNLFRTTLDATGPLSRDGSLFYRTIFSYLNTDQFITHAPHGTTEFVAPSLSWHPNTKLVMNLDFEYRNMDPLIANGIPAIGNRPADIPITTYLGGDVGDRANVNRKFLDLNASYAINPSWNVHGAAAVTFDNIDFEQFFGGSLDETPGPTFGDFTNIPWFDKRRSKGGNAFLDVTGRFHKAGIEHTLLMGTDYYLLDFWDRGFVNGWAPVDTMNIFNPVFRRPTAYGAHALLSSTPPDWTSVGTTGWHGLYVQDQMKIWRNVRLLVGGRYDWARARAGGITLEYADPGSTLNDVVKTTSNQHKFSPRIGLLYQPVQWLSIYGNYVNSLGTWGTSNVIAVDINGHPLPAQRSYSYEGGVKVEALNGRLRSTLSVFDITKTNVATRDLASPDPNALRAVGEAHSSGVEVDVSGALTQRLSVIGSYAFTDAKFSKDNSGLQGLQIANVPRQSGSLWLRSELIREKLAVGAGAFLRGQRQGDNENTFQLPGYVTLDAYAAYTFKWERARLTPQLNIINLLDKRYFLNTNVYDAYPRLGIMPGQPFTVMGSIRWEY